MTDRLKGCTITFDHDIREDDADAILQAMRMIKGVAHVEPSIVTASDFMIEQRVRLEVRRMLFDLAQNFKVG